MLFKLIHIVCYHVRTVRGKKSHQFMVIYVLSPNHSNQF